jgi:hypothetical protein
MSKPSVRLPLLVALALLAFVGVGAVRGQQKRPDNKELEACARACSSCSLECEACYRHCAGLVAGGEKKHANTARLCRDCSDVCSLAARIVARRGPAWQLVCDACAKTCDACGKRCDEFKDEHMQKCSKACRDCSKACRAMIAAAKKPKG